MTKFIATIIGVAFMLSTLPIFSISSDLEIQLLHKALMEGAVTKEQKSAVSHFMTNIANEKKKEADKYREMASISYGGKAASQDLRSKSLLEQARILDSEAKNYEGMASKFENNNTERVAKLQ